jgi:hypothetical protein
VFRRNTNEKHRTAVLLTAAVLIPLTAGAQPRPGNPTTATVITKAEIDKIAATMQNVTTRDENARVVDIGDGWSMELGIIHRAKQRVLTVGEARAQAARGNAPAAAGRGNAQAAEQRAPCGQQMANAPDDALQGAITHDFQTEGFTSSRVVVRRSLTARLSTAGRARTTPTADRTARAAAAAWRLAHAKSS